MEKAGRLCSLASPLSLRNSSCHPRRRRTFDLSAGNRLASAWLPAAMVAWGEERRGVRPVFPGPVDGVGSGSAVRSVRNARR
jgi:hypothetical protein